MVILHVKKGDQSLFLYSTNTSVKIEDLTKDLVEIYNGKLKIERLIYEINEMSKYGVCLPSQMQGLAPEQINELNLQDSWRIQNITSASCIINPDPIGKRNGYAPTKKYADVLTKTTAEAKARISKELIDSGKTLTLQDIKEILEILEGAVTIVNPMGLPSYETIHLEFKNKQDLSGTQAGKEILEGSKTEIWWANKKLDETKKLCDYIGKNEKSKLIVKLQKKGQGPPGREPVFTEQQKKDLMLAEYRRREEMKRLEIDDSDSHLDSQWADNKALQKNFHGLTKIKFK